MPAERDFYQVLGIPPHATSSEVRETYLARSRIIHPDRFDREEQPREWKKANEMLVELNEAYCTLKDPETRRAYDHRRVRPESSPPPRAEPSQTSRQSKPAASPPFANGFAGYFAFHLLPTAVQHKLLSRQRDKNEDQFATNLDWGGLSLIFVVILGCWFVYLIYAAFWFQWGPQTWFWYAAITLVVGLFVGANVPALVRFGKSTLTPHFYVTPLYFIKTGYDTVCYWPFWSLRDVAITHEYKDGSYQSSQVVLKFEQHQEALTIYSEAKVHGLFAKMREYDQRIRAAIETNNESYFRAHDDFQNLSPSVPSIRDDDEHCTFVQRAAHCTGSLAASVVFLVATGLVNANFADKRWVRHSDPPAVTPSTARNDSSGPSTRVQTSRNESWRDAPLVVPPGKHWTDLVSDEPLTQDEARSIGVASPPKARISSSGTELVARPSLPIQPLPENGRLKLFTSASRLAPFEIRAATGNHYLVKLVNTATNTPVMTIFVKSGSTVAVDVPLGVYEVRYASGTEWYGDEYLFGTPGTSYSKADTLFDFAIRGNQVSGFTITLYKVADGNLSTTEIGAAEF